MKKIIALALVIVMLFALSACGKKEEAAAPTVAPAPVEAVQPEAVEPEPAPEATIEPVEVLPIETEPVLIEEDSGIYTFTSDVNGFSFDFDSKYVAMQNPLGNVTVFAGTDTGIPYCSIGIMPDAAAEAYLTEIVTAADIELGSKIISKTEVVAVTDYSDREVFHTSYVYSDDEVGGNVVCVYYAEKLENNSSALYSSIALEGQTEAVDSILKLAIDTFKLAE